jgi:hypothetical protein
MTRQSGAAVRRAAHADGYERPGLSPDPTMSTALDSRRTLRPYRRYRCEYLYYQTYYIVARCLRLHEHSLNAHHTRPCNRPFVRPISATSDHWERHTSWRHPLRVKGRRLFCARRRYRFWYLSVRAKFALSLVTAAHGSA